VLDEEVALGGLRGGSSLLSQPAKISAQASEIRQMHNAERIVFFMIFSPLNDSVI
jgi:hypothetical protein